MSFQVTPETDVAEAAMFHGARVELSSNQAMTAGYSKVEFDTAVFDTDGFFDSGNNEFVIPEGVSFVRVGCGLTINDAGTPPEAKMRIRTAGVGSHVLMTFGSPTANTVDSCMLSGVIPVSTGDDLFVEARYLVGTPNILSSAGTSGTFFWIEAVKTPLGRPDSPTLP